MKTHQHLSKQAKAIGYISFLAGIFLVMSSCSANNMRANVRARKGDIALAGVVPVTRQNLSNTLEIASEFVPYQEIDVHAKVSGYVKKLYIDWGTHVRQGQLLAVLEVPELLAQVNRDMAAVQRAQKDVERVQQELARDQSAYQVADVTYKRLYRVQKLNPHLVAQEEVDVAHGKDLESQAAVSADQAALAAAQEELAADKSTLQRDEALADYARITAPFPGVVTRLDGYTGALLPAGTSSSKSDLSLCHLAENDILRLVIPVPEEFVPDVKVGETVNVKVPALNKTFEGKVSLTSDQIDLSTRTMHTEVEVKNPHYEIIPGMYAYVDLPIRRAVNTIAIPIQAVVRSGGNSGTVLVVNRSHTIERRTVRLGIETPNLVEVLSGLKEGEQVIFGEQSGYRPGEKVQVRVLNPMEFTEKGA
jgi:RND family efflux transporter MFP subunit